MSDPRTFNEAIENMVSPFAITPYHLMKCQCGHSVSFHHFNGLCKGSVTEDCGCTEVRLEKHNKNNMEIIKYPAQSLLEKSVAVNLEDQATTIFLLDFLGFYLTLAGKAVGLAAPQVGNNIRAFIAQDDLYLNPLITKRSRGTYEAFEGCLSLEEGETYKVRRHKEITMEWTDASGDKHTERLEGFRAEVIQHEYDHLEGKLINS